MTFLQFWHFENGYSKIEFILQATMEILHGFDYYGGRYISLCVYC